MRSMWAVELSVWIGVQGCRWLSSWRVWRIDRAVLALTNNAPISASAAEDITVRMICDILRTAPVVSHLPYRPEFKHQLMFPDVTV